LPLHGIGKAKESCHTLNRNRPIEHFRVAEDPAVFSKLIIECGIIKMAGPPRFRHAPIRSPNVARDSHSEFQFYDVIIFKDDESYHAQLKGWLARQREVYREIVAGLVKQGLITSERAAKPMGMNIYGIDARRPSAHSNVTFLKEAPWSDVVPENTEVMWIGG
jgi:hypothetical protein